MARGPADPNAGSQTPETIDDAPTLDDNIQETYQNFPPEPSKPPKKVHQTRSPATGDHHQPQAFPPPQEHHHQPHAFPPPQHDPHQPQAFPPPQHEHGGFQKPQAFPPQHEQGDFQKPQAFPPQHEQGDFQKPQAFPPQHEQGDFQKPQAFPPSQSHGAQGGFHGAQAFPPQQNQAFHQQTNFANPPGQMPFNSPMPFQQALPTEPWKTDLFGCMDDPQNAIVTACFPCVTFGQIAEIIDSGNSSCATSGMMYGCVAFLIAMPCLLSCTYRTKLRARYGLMETPGPDWLVHCFCEWCALCQAYRELQHRGLDPAIGWQGNQARAQMMQHGSMTPPMKQNMMS